MMDLSGNGQVKAGRPAIVDITSFKDYLDLSFTQFKVAFSAGSLQDFREIPQLKFSDPALLLKPTGRLPDSLNKQHVYVQLQLLNTSHSVRELFLYAGFYFKSKHVFKSSDGGFEHGLDAMPDVLPDVPDADHYRLIRMKPGETCTYYLQLQPVNIFGNKLDVQILQPGFLALHDRLIKREKNGQDIVTYILVGVLFMMALFSLSNFLVTKKQEFLHYFFYVVLTSLLLFFKTYLYHSATNFNYFFEEYLDFILQIVSIIFYVYFLRVFLEADVRYPLLNKILTGLEVINILFIVVYSFTYFLSDNISWLNIMENAMKMILLAGAAVFIIAGVQQKNKLLNYIILGNASILVFGLISLLLIIKAPAQNSLFKNPLFYYDLGIVFEMAFFLLGLTYKNRQELISKVKMQDAITIEKDRKHFERQLAMIQAQQEERNRISADMHDELGGGMTAIRLMSEIAKQRNEAGQIPELDKISVSANELLGKMNVIIWSMSLLNDSLANLVAYTRSYALEFFENTDINCIVLANECDEHIELSGLVRRNLFFAVKEALQNVAADATVTEAKLFFEWNGDERQLRITLTDNSKEFFRDKNIDAENRWDNIIARMGAVNGSGDCYYQSGNVVLLVANI